MRDDLYYDWSARKPLSKEDGCRYDNWPLEHANYPFALHPQGFPVFLKPHHLQEYDEYSQGDPHGVKNGLTGEFQKRRIACTLHLLELAAAQKSGQIRLLDLGCGEGHITNKMRQALPNAQISALDRSLSAVIYAATHYPGIDFCAADAYDPPYLEDHFDIVVCNNTWEDVADPVFLFSRVTRIIEPGGHLIISTPSRYRLENLLRVLLGRPAVLAAPNHVTEYSVGQVLEQLAFGGFDVEKIYSRPKKEKLSTISALIAYKIVKPLLSAYLAVTKSHHCLESTVFFLARKNAPS